jgi:hypothetical protein
MSAKRGAGVLLGAPYAAPEPCDGYLDDEIDGRLRVGRWTSAPIPWPCRKKSGRPSLIFCGDLVRAVKTESVADICRWWGVGQTKVWMWRQALGVGRVTAGTRKRLQDNTGVPPDASARGRERAARPESREKMAASKRGKPMHPKTRAALTAAASQPKPQGWGHQANAWMLAAKKQGDKK